MLESKLSLTHIYQQTLLSSKVYTIVGAHEYTHLYKLLKQFCEHYATVKKLLLLKTVMCF